MGPPLYEQTITETKGERGSGDGAQANCFAPVFLQAAKRLLRFPLTRDDSKCPISNFLAAGKPFVGPGKKNGPGKTALYHAIDMPAEHFRLLVLRMSDGVHAEFAKDKWTLARKILQPQQITARTRPGCGGKH